MAKEIAYKVTVDTSEVDEGVERTTDSVEELGDATQRTSKQMQNGFDAAGKGAANTSKGINGIGTSIGGLIKSLGLLAVAFAVFEYLRDLLMKNQRVADTFAKAFRVVDIVFGRVTKAVEDLIDALRSLKEINLKSIADSFKIFGQQIAGSADGAIELAEKLVDLENKVKKADAAQRLFALTMQKEIEIQRQIRDDISLTISERQAANDKIAVLLQRQLDGEKRVANDRLELAKLESQINNDNIESQVAVLEARTEIADIEERITGVLSEQKTNREALRQEENELAAQRMQGYQDAKDFLREAEVTNDFEAQIRAVQHEMFTLSDEYVNALNGMRQYLKDNNEGITADQIENNEQMIAIEAAYQRRYNDLVKRQADIRRMYVEASALQLAAALGSISQSVQQMGKDGVVASKVLGVAQIAIDTAVAISGAIAQAQSVPFPGNLAAIATGVAAVISGIASATQIINGANVAGPNATSPTTPVINTSAPTFTPITTNTTELGNTEQAELAPIQAFVVETQITGSQNNVNQIESQATFA